MIGKGPRLFKLGQIVDLRLRTKLVLGYAAMSVCVTFVCLLGGRVVRAHAESERAGQGQLIHRTAGVESEVRSGTEAGLAFLLTRNSEERRRSLAMLDAAAEDAGRLAESPFASTDEGELLKRAVLSIGRLRASAVALFEDFDLAQVVKPDRYIGFKAAADSANDQLAAFDAFARGVGTRELERSARESDALTALIGLAAIVVAMAIGVAHAKRIGENDGGAERDRDDRKGMDLEVRRAQKMEAVGRLAGGIANEFNNNLSIILGYSGIALDGMSAGDPMFIPLSEIKQAGERSAELTRQLLLLSRHQPQETRVLDVGWVVENMRPMMSRVLGEKVEVDLVRDTVPCTVEAPEGQIEQVLTNLVLNARDAMPDGGKLRIEVRTVDVAERDAKNGIGLRSGRYVLLRVADTGVGMSGETQERIFEPFFTTKEGAKRELGPGAGLGLGLSTVFGVVQQRSGHIHVQSEPGKGATFEVYIPETKPRALRFQETPSSGTTRAARTILVVEDEEQVLRVVEQILRRHRYGVLVAQNAKEALSICEGHPGNIDLLVTDVVLREINGPELAEQLLEHRPDMKVLYMSGYTGDVELVSGEDGEASSFLQKPVTPETLRRKVRGILHSIRPPGPPMPSA